MNNNVKHLIKLFFAVYTRNSQFDYNVCLHMRNDQRFQYYTADYLICTERRQSTYKMWVSISVNLLLNGHAPIGHYTIEPSS